MTKQEAADLIGISTRSLERHVKANRIAARYEKGKTSDVLVFERADVERFKAELDKPTHLPSVERAAEPNRMNASTATTPTKPDNRDNVLANFGEVDDANAGGGALALLRALASLQLPAPDAPASAPSSGAPVTPPAQKLLLSLAEAQSYSGLSRANLMEAIGAETLPAQKIGRGWKIKRRDLESYIDGL